MYFVIVSIFSVSYRYFLRPMTLDAPSHREFAELVHLFHLLYRTVAGLAFNLAGIFGASLAPYIATWLGERHGLASVGWYLAGAAVLSFIALWTLPRDGAPGDLPAGR